VGRRFERLLISTCDIYRRGVGAPDEYDETARDLTLLEMNVKCRKSILGPDDEFIQDKQFAIGVEKVFMLANPLGSFSEELSEHHMLVIDGLLYDIKSVKNPSNMNHHLEVYVLVIKP
jgi:hypothetical protein